MSDDKVVITCEVKGVLRHPMTGQRGICGHSGMGGSTCMKTGSCYLQKVEGLELPPLAKPCPFCGGEAYHQLGARKLRITDKVQCLTCFAEVEGTHDPQSALAVWNKRVEIPRG